MSIRIYVDKVLERLPRHGISGVKFDDPSRIPEADVLWDPRTGGGRAPTEELVAKRLPLVVTLHDMAHVSLPWREFYPGLRDALIGRIECYKVARQWRRGLARVARVIVPSTATLNDAVEHLNIDESRIAVIPHGVDHDLFSLGNEEGRPHHPAPYFLHISQYQKRKNIQRLIEAYDSLAFADKPHLVLKLIGYEGPRSYQGVTFIDGVLSPQEIASLYRGALAFVFPSMNEGFGLPVLEAMACGCPVVTSKGTACAEVADGAALLVDPYSVADIAGGLKRLACDASERERLRQETLMRARLYNWDKSADLHARVFNEAAA
jgi:glycosyltransferase involved in cell wall biosynthesis